MVPFSAIILTGGKSRRMGVPKHTIKINGKTFLDIAISSVSTVTSQIYISGNPSDFLNCKYPVISDSLSGCGPLVGLFSSLKKIPTDLALVIPVDMPFLNITVLKKLIQKKSGNFQATIASFREQQQPLCAVYSKSCLQAISEQIKIEDFKIQNFLEKITVNEVFFDDSMPFISEKTFLNINTPEDLNF